MKFIIVADIHFDNPNDQGFSMQEKYTEQAGEEDATDPHVGADD